MNSPKEPEPGPGRCAVEFASGKHSGRILRMAFREGQGFVPWAGVEEFIRG